MELSTLHRPTMMLDPPGRSSAATRPPSRMMVAESCHSGVHVSSRGGVYIVVKPTVEFALALLMLVALAPVIAVAAIATRLTSKGPAFFRQTRVGKSGREFRVWKIRSMVLDAEARTGPVWSTDQDPRVTPLGRFLRASHIDEFPQLLNVLAGDMSLVGPRPERPEFVAQLEWQLPGYGQRLDVRPGITGLAQVCLPPDSDLESVRRKLVHDLYYVDHRSFWLDLTIVAYTGLGLLRTLLSACAQPFQLPRPDVVFGHWDACADKILASDRQRRSPQHTSGRA